MRLQSGAGWKTHTCSLRLCTVTLSFCSAACKAWTSCFIWRSSSSLRCKTACTYSTFQEW